MKMKKALLSVAFLLATSGAMAAMSFTSAKVESGASFSVVNTDEALLAVYPGTTTNHNAAYIDGKKADKTGKLVIDLDKGYENKDYGVQNGSTYTWNDLFRVKNNSEHAIKVKVSAQKTSGTNSLGVEGEAEAAFIDWCKIIPGLCDQPTPPGTSNLVIENAGNSNLLEFELQPGKEHFINLNLITKDVKKGEKGYNVVVEATKK